jgi:hypothetical protein
MKLLEVARREAVDVKKPVNGKEGRKCWILWDLL